MITVYLQGGLGNQLFQIFACISYSLKYNVNFKLPIYNQNQENSKSNSGYPRPTYWNNLLVNLKNNLQENNKLLSIKKFREKNTLYNEIPKHDYDLQLYGFFQSHKYFEENYNKILEIIKIDNLKQIIYEKNKNLFTNNTVSMHFRLGDYKNVQHCHPILNADYYERALSEINNKTKKINVIFFCEDEDIEFVNNVINQFKKKINFEFKRGQKIGKNC